MGIMESGVLVFTLWLIYLTVLYNKVFKIDSLFNRTSNVIWSQDVIEH